METEQAAAPAAVDPSVTETLDRICELCQTLQCRVARELPLQDAIETLLRENFLGVMREAKLSPGSIVDFLVNSVGLEVKTDGAPTHVLRQIQRYAESDLVQAMVLVTTRAKHREMPNELRGKPVRVVWLSPF